jgi:KUP system potassium uptake protein
MLNETKEDRGATPRSSRTDIDAVEMRSSGADVLTNITTHRSPSLPKPKSIKRPGSLHHQAKQGLSGLALVCVSAIGVVFGDIGTSPLYVYKSVFPQVAVTNDNVLGVASLIFYNLTLVVCIKYLIFVMRADQQKEGGVFALLSLILFGSDGGKHNVLYDAVPLKKADNSGAGSPSSSLVEFGSLDINEKKLPHRWLAKRNLRRVYIILSMAGSGMLLGDGVITPAISVLSAVEGLEIVSTSFTPAIMPITVVLLIGLFVVQRFGTRKVGTCFGPVMICWFFSIASIGIYNITFYPDILHRVGEIKMEGRE